MARSPLVSRHEGVVHGVLIFLDFPPDGGSAAANIDRYIKSILGLLQGRVRVGLGCYRGRVGCYG